MTSKLNRQNLMKEVHAIIVGSTNDPAEDLIAMGQALISIGETLRGRSNGECRAIMHAVMALEGGDIAAPKNN